MITKCISLFVGRTFFFRVNGRPIFAKGSNQIPFHVLPEAVTKEQVKWMLKSAKEANMNMIRVWGGGIYESDYFYEVIFRYNLTKCQMKQFFISN